MKLDFSEFHPLDHHALNPRCASYPGGFRRHVRYWALYQFDLLKPWHWLRCKLAKHDWVPFWRSLDDIPPTVPASGMICRYCWAEQ